MQNMHGIAYRVCTTRLWSHVFVYQVWQAIGRVPHMQTKCSASHTGF